MFDWSDGCGGFRRPVRGSYGLDSAEIAARKLRFGQRRDCCAESDGLGGSCDFDS